MINRNSALTPSVYGEGETQMNTSTVLSEENATGVPPRPTRRQHQSNDDRANHMAPQMARPLNQAMNSTVNRGFKQAQPVLQNTRAMNQDGSGGQINLHNVPTNAKGRAGYGALI